MPAKHQTPRSSSPAWLSRTFPVDDLDNQAVLELVEVPDDGSVTCFPVHAAGKTFGMVGVPVAASAVWSQYDSESIRQFLDVAALCLLNTRRHEAQARHTRELQQEDELLNCPTTPSSKFFTILSSSAPE